MNAYIVSFDIRKSRNYDQQVLWHILNDIVDDSNDIFMKKFSKHIEILNGDEANFVVRYKEDAFAILQHILNEFSKHQIKLWTVIGYGYINPDTIYKKHNDIRENNLFIYSFLYLNNKNQKYNEWFGHNNGLNLDNYLSIREELNKSFKVENNIVVDTTLEYKELF